MIDDDDEIEEVESKEQEQVVVVKLTGEEADNALREANALKEQGNALFGQKQYKAAIEAYSAALAKTAGTEFSRERAVFLCNRAAAHLGLEAWSDAVRDCTDAVALDAAYAKAYMRRATAHEALQQYVAAHDDFAKVCELEPQQQAASLGRARTAPLAEQERERQKAEMLGKLKDLGNSLLGRFGLSLDNFVTQQDPATGSYSLNFKQNK